ncbi:invasin domain 3-containing protein [Citrobacter freundii]|uniref:invasin domain 3-containing protein n=1 Tax=Citrobacter freundii TaxID=546 RepID=UPI002B24CF0A|nr:invasin domain 3-containing protein [Citrobacter freundii]MEB2478194.1 invasin domain 3-containing protein [Citrobacter freundii]
MTISPKNSSFTASPKSGNQLLADGNGGSTLTFTAQDASGNPVTGLTDIGFASSLTGSTVSPSPAVETPAGSGIYIAKLTSTAAGDATVSVTDKGTVIAGIATQKVTFKAAGPTTPGPIAGTHSDFDATPASGATLIADNSSTSSLTFTAKDANDVLVKGLTDITITADIPEATVSAVTETPANSGIYKATVKSSKAGAVVLTVKQGGTAITGVATKTVTFKAATVTPGPLSGTTTKMTIAPATFVHGTAAANKAVITVKAKDAANVAIPNLSDLSLVLSGADASKAAVTALTESPTEAGTYTADMTATAAATAVVVTLQQASTDVSGVSTLTVNIT